MAVKQQKKSTKVESKSNWILLLGVAISTLYVHTNARDPFNTPKLIVILLVSSWLMGYLVNSLHSKKIKIFSKAFIPFLISVLFIFFLSISLAATDLKFIGLIGDTQRRNGFLQYFAMIIIFLCAYININFSNVVRIYKVSIFTGLLVSAYGVAQITGRDFRDWNNPYNAMISTLGNPNFASALLAILSVLSFSALLIDDLSRFNKAIAILVIFLSVFAIIRSQSRQGLVTIAVSLLAFVSIYSYLKNKKIGLLINFFSAGVFILLILGMLQKGPLTSLLYKPSVTVRGYYWKAGVEMFKDRPLTGVGIDRYGSYFKEFRNSEYGLKYGFDITSTNAHNTVIQLFATSGFFVGLLYLLIFFMVLYSGLKALPNLNNDSQKILLGLISAWIGFHAQSFISIDNIGISVWGWLLGGSILGLSWMSKDGNTVVEKNLSHRGAMGNPKIQILQLIVSMIFFLPTAVFTYYLGQSEIDVSNVQLYTNPNAQENREAVFNFAAQVLSNPISDPNHKYVTALSLYDMGYKQQGYSEVKRLSEYDPRNLDYLNGLLFFEAGNTSELIKIRSKIALYDPWNAKNLYNLMLLQNQSGDSVKVDEIKNKILSFAPLSEFGILTREFTIK